MIYPGADEVPLALLSRYFVDLSQKLQKVFLVFRNPDSIDLVPSYEGEPMIDTLLNQVKACGGTRVETSI